MSEQEVFVICTNNGPYVPSYETYCVRCHTHLWRSFQAPEGTAICKECAIEQMAKEGGGVIELPEAVVKEGQNYLSREKN
jgi:hypothetical protein